MIYKSDVDYAQIYYIFQTFKDGYGSLSQSIYISSLRPSGLAADTTNKHDS